MNESSWWSSHIKPRWHNPTKGQVAWKVQDAFNAGLPDVDVVFSGVAAKLELKYDVAWPKRPGTPVWFSTLDKVTRAKAIVSAAQFNHLQQWHQGGGNAFVLIGIGREWVLLEQGAYENRPMTQAELCEAAVLTYIGPQARDYNALAEIPPFIERYYARRDDAPASP